MCLEKCRIIDLPKITDARGSLTFIEGDCHLPFNFNRLFFLYEIPRDASRGGHALINCDQFLVAISGSFNVFLDDGSKKCSVPLNRPNSGLYIPPLIWREMNNFADRSICLVLASKQYDDNDYVRSYNDFLRLVEQRLP